MSSLLSVQSHYEQATNRVHLETDGAYPLKASLVDAPRINTGRCTGCGRCVAACPLRLFTLDQIGFHKTCRLRFSDRCTRCGLCIESCPVAAISA
ncbi:MAG: 4Fe-4S binding protein [Geobacteraceae bacterium]|nr:4Fe-4S binding protein [Geobacteraceae bacterium]